MSDGPLCVTFYWRGMEQKTIGDHWQALSTQYLSIVETTNIFQKKHIFKTCKSLFYLEGQHTYFIF